MSIFFKRQKGLLIFALTLTLFMLAMEFALLGAIENTRSRVLSHRRRMNAENLAEIGAQYAGYIQSKYPGKYIAQVFSPSRLKLEHVMAGKPLNRYSFSSPDILGKGSFTLEYYYTPSGNKLVRMVSVGQSGGILREKVVRESEAVKR